jgi:hypothetical protein
MNPTVTELRFAPAVSSMTGFVEGFRPWIEEILGCPIDQTLTLEFQAPLGEIAAEELLANVVLDRECLSAGDGLRPLVTRWAVPPGVSPRIDLSPSRRRDALATSRQLAWDPHWKETPVAAWLRGLVHPVVGVRIPFISFREGPRSEMQYWVIVRRDEAGPALTLLRGALPQRKMIEVIGGHPLRLETGYDWDRLVRDDGLELVCRDFEAFLAREEWFRRHRLPYRRGYFLYGPPGNGKTSVIQVMAAHPLVEAYTLDFSDRELGNGALSELFDRAGHTAPALVILEDLDRLYAEDASGDNLTRITLQHLLSCLDGIASRDGVIVVATANEPKHLDPAILRRPGRFDRVVACRQPSRELRRIYLTRLCAATVPPEAIAEAADRSDGFSFAQLREAYILGGQLAFGRSSEEVSGTDLLEGVALLAGEMSDITVRTDGRALGFNARDREWSAG